MTESVMVPLEIGSENEALLTVGEGAVGAGPGEPSFMARVQAWVTDSALKAMEATAPLWPALGTAIGVQQAEVFGRRRPVNGDPLRAAKPAFDDTLRTLNEARPRNWVGAAADQYGRQVQTQIDLVLKCLEYDHDLSSKLLDPAADNIEYYRFLLEVWIAVAVGAIIVVAALAQTDVFSAVVCGRYLAAAVFAAIIATVLLPYDYQNRSANLRQSLITHYAGIAEYAENIFSAQAPALMVSGVSDVSVAAGGWLSQETSPSLFRSAGAGNSSPVERDIPWIARVSPPATPTASAPSQFFGQVAPPSRHVLSPPVVGQAAEPVQQRVSTANRAADHHRVDAPAKDADGAAAEPAHGVPVAVVAAGAEQNSPSITGETHV